MRTEARSVAVAVGLALAAASAFASDGGDGSADAGSLQRELAELEKTRLELEGLTKQLDEQRVTLERQNEAARAQQNLIFVAAGVAILVLVGGGVAWARTRRRGGDQRDKTDG